MLQELRTQTQKHRDENTNNMREISKLKRKEKNATDAVRRLERSNQLQRLMLKKRNEEVIRSQNKLKQIMRSLKRAATPNKIMKSQYPSGFSSPVPGSRNGRRNHGPSMNEILASVNSPVRLSVSQSFTDTRPEEVDLQAQFKKQMVDKELSCTISCRKAQRDLEKLKDCRRRLVDEQKELISERKRVVQANFQATGVLDDKAPQYMDDRVQSIDVEVASIDQTISQLEEKLKRNSSIIDDETISSFVDLSWDNALNILRALDRVELEATIAYFLEDVVNLRTIEEELQQELEDKENSVEALKSKLFDAQESLFQALNDAHEKMLSKPENKSMEVQTTLSSEVIVDDIESEEELPRYIPKRKLKENVEQFAELSIADIENRSLPRTSRSLSADGGMSTAISPIPDENWRGRPLQSRNSVESRRRSSSPAKEKPFGVLNPLKREESLSHQSSTTTLKFEEETKPRKKYDLLTMGSDVFKRLANAHTQASQAKVIHRTSLDKDSLLQEPSPSTESKRKSFAELEQNWNMDTT
jgi:kinesin family protein 4/21/27